MFNTSRKYCVEEVENKIHSRGHEFDQRAESNLNQVQYSRVSVEWAPELT